MNPPFELDSLLPRNVKAKVNEIIRYLRATKLHVDSSMQLNQNSAGIVLKSRARGGRGGSGSSMSGLFQIDLKTENGSAEISITSADSSNCGFILHHYDAKTPESVTSVEAVKSLSIKNSKVQYLWLKVWKPGENKKPEFEVTEKSAPPEKGHAHFLIAQILRDEKDFIINPCENSALHCWWPDKNAVGPFAVTIDEQAKTVHVAAGYALANGVAFDVPAASFTLKKGLVTVNISLGSDGRWSGPKIELGKKADALNCPVAEILCSTDKDGNDIWSVDQFHVARADFMITKKCPVSEE